MAYENSRVAVDAVVFTIHEDKLKVFIRKREKAPFKGKFELPGGLLKEKETSEKTLSRKINELVTSDPVFFQQFYTFTEPKRDPRTRTVSIGFLALINSEQIQDYSPWHTISSLKREMAFDHEHIIDVAFEYLKKEINSLIVKQFLPELFPLNRLQNAYEIILGESYDNRNFRRKMINSGVVIETKKLQRDVSHRPAKLYKFRK
jgi:8-oxo-dGTP diphosphatase